MPYVNLSMQSLYYARHLSRWSDPTPVIFIHGAGGSHLFWPPSLRRLGPGYTTYLPDLPAHGRSSGAGRASVEAYVDVVLEFIRVLGLTSVILAGHSMGGAVALLAALRHPHLCRKLVLFNSAAHMAVPNEIMAALGAGREPAVDAICRYACVPDVPADLIEVTRKSLSEISLDTLRADYMACQSFDVRGLVGEIAVPTLIVGAEDDLLTPPEGQRWLAEMIWQSRLVVLERCGHLAVLTNADECREALLEFPET